MSHDYTLHTVMVATCPICGGELSDFIGELRKVDLSTHVRAGARGDKFVFPNDTSVEICPGSGMSVQLKAADDRPQPSSASAPSDDEPFPFGKYKGVRYGDIPADYLDWITSLPWLNKWPKVVAYIEKNRANIDKDLEAEGKI